MHQYKFAKLKFKDGGFDQKIVYDRYSTPEHDFDKMNVGDIVVVRIDKNKDQRKVGILIDKFRKTEDSIWYGVVETRESFDGETVNYETNAYEAEQIAKPLDLQPVDLWDRWALAGASEEPIDKREHFYHKFAEYLFDGFRYSLGGRIQLMAGQEYRTGEKADLTSYNCYVGPYPDVQGEIARDKSELTKLAENEVYELGIPKSWRKQASYNKTIAKNVFKAIIKNLEKQAEIMARGGGYGITYDTVPEKVVTPLISRNRLALYLPDTHPDFTILQDMKLVGKFDNVQILNNEAELDNFILSNNPVVVRPEDSRGSLVSNMYPVVEALYDDKFVVVDFSSIRYKGALVKGVNGRSSGAPSWMFMYSLIADLLVQEFVDAVDLMELPSEETKLIEQGGSRRGALMLMLSCRHGNIFKFIHRKKTKGKLTYANLSVNIDDLFMQQVKNNEVEQTKLWNDIMESAWQSAEPGVVFMEYYNKMSNSWYYNTIVATNPCGR